MKLMTAAITAFLGMGVATAVVAQQPHNFGDRPSWCYMIQQNGEVIDLSPMCDRPTVKVPSAVKSSSGDREFVDPAFEDILRSAGRSEAVNYCAYLREGVSREEAFAKAEADSIFPRRLTTVERARVDVYRENEVILRCGVIDRAISGGR